MSHIVLKKLTIGILSLLLSIVARAQLTTEPFSYNTDLTPSVESWKMTQHGSLRPPLYTGTMTYSLSLYTYSDEAVATGGETVRPGCWKTASDVLPNIGDYIVTSGKIRAQSRIAPYPADPYHIDIFTDEPAVSHKEHRRAEQK